MIVVSDTTPLISLMKVSLLDILQQLFGEIIIPAAVFDELTANSKFSFEAEQIKSCGFIRVLSVGNTDAVHILQHTCGLDLGESEAIALADDTGADFLFMDEARGRRVAKELGLRIMGTVGILLAAKDDGLLTKSDVENALEGLKASNRRISEEIIAAAKKRLE